jgi:hypothetical protein
MSVVQPQSISISAFLYELDWMKEMIVQRRIDFEGLRGELFDGRRGRASWV